LVVDSNANDEPLSFDYQVGMQQIEYADTHLYPYTDLDYQLKDYAKIRAKFCQNAP
jgi:hypothetical protein